jgi:hypothetical protein
MPVLSETDSRARLMEMVDMVFLCGSRASP